MKRGGEPSADGILEPDICVIGAGSGGLSVAAGAAAFGASVVLIERGRMGGDCLNHGCVPSKSLIAAARAADTVRHAERFGVHAGEPRIDYGTVMDHVHAVIAKIAPFDSVERFTGLGVKVLQAQARFIDPQTIEAGAHRIRARRFVVASGSSPLVPDLPGLANVPFLTNETLFANRHLPSHLIVLGGGPIGLEMAQAHRRLGSKVTVIEAATALAREDPELAAFVTRRLAADGVVLNEQTSAVAVERRGDGIAVVTRQGDAELTVTGSHLLVAIGRSPNVEGLGLAAAGIEVDAKGICVGQDLRTTNRRVYAIGDVAGQGQFTHLAGQHAGLVLRAILFRLPVRQTPDRVPRVTFTDPELGQVGLTQAEADRRGLGATTQSWSFAEIDRARTDDRTDGLLKLVVGKQGALLGAGVVGANAGELINLFSLALSKSLAMRDLMEFLSPYPTYAEIGKRAATAYHAPYARHRLVRATVRMLSRLG